MTSSSDDQFTSLAPHYDELMAPVPYSAWVDYVLRICKRHKHAPRQVLDCACGTGNVSFELAARGFDVVGVDISREMIDIAKQKSPIKSSFFSKSTFAKPEFIESDLCEMDLNRQFDTVTCLYDSLNYLTDPQMLTKAFLQISKHLQPHGLFIFDMNTPYAFESDMFTQSDFRPNQKLQYNWVANYDPHTRICQVEMIYTRRDDMGKKDRFTETHCERSYTMTEIKDCLYAGNLQLKESFDSYRIAPPHARSERWYFVACKREGAKDDQISQTW